jgi:RNA polymerase sigma factor (sigma-70 family)
MHLGRMPSRASPSKEPNHDHGRPMEHVASYLAFSLNRRSDRPAPAEAAQCEGLDVTPLTRRMTEGDEAAYRAFFGIYFDRLSRYLLVVTAGDEEATREALQRTLTRVVRYIRVFATEDAFWSWLTVLARTALWDESRKRRRYLAFLDRFTRHADTQPLAQNADQSDQWLADALERNLAALSAEDRQLLDWKYFERWSVRQIAEHRQTTEKAIESRLGRIRRSLKQAMMEELKHEPQT